MKVVFPVNIGQRYYRFHYQYLLDMFKAAGCDISFGNGQDYNTVSCWCLIDSKKVSFDFGDNPVVLNCPDHGRVTFKFHCSSKIKWPEHVKPFAPISFYDWKQYHQLQTEITYIADGNIISSRQTPYGDAVERRNYVHGLLKKSHGDNTKTNTIQQVDYWKEIGNILVSVCVGGFCNNMLDRGQLQYMAFGACTISPEIPEHLPYMKSFLPNEHYIKCKDDYSDLLEKIEWCKNNRKECVSIGKASKELFKETSTPERVTNWILAKI